MIETHLICSIANINKLGHEDHIPGQVRDWNEELQITKELPKKSLPERLIRERAMFKVNNKMGFVHGRVMSAF